MDKWIAILAVAVPVLQIALMGFIGYPIARRSRGGMDAFHRSGFIWWLIALLVVVVSGIVVSAGLLEPTSPSTHELTTLRVPATVGASLAALIVIEALGSVLVKGARSERARRERERYESALPRWAASAPAEAGVLTATAVLEEAVYRGIALSGLLMAWDADKPVAAGIVAAAFGLAHWYYGPRQVLLKTLIGSVLCATAFSAGWVAAAVTHVLFNLALVAWSRKRSG